MKRIFIASGIVAALAGLTACDKYDIYPEQYGEVMMIKDAGDRRLTIYATDDVAPCYISVMKSGHSPENPADATLKFLTDEEFGDYKELYYGDRNFKGLAPLNPAFYYLADADKNKVGNGQISHQFSDADDRYFGANVMFDAGAISDWYQNLQNRANMNIKDTDPDKALKEQQKKEAKDSIDSYTFVVPMGLFSTSDSINADNKYVMVIPTVTNPVVSVNVSDFGYYIDEISRAELKNANSDFSKGMQEPQVIFSIPCANDYGFKIKTTSAGNEAMEAFAKINRDVILTKLPKKSGTVDNYDYNNRVPFPKDVTEVRIPLSFFRSSMDPDNVDTKYVVPISLDADKGDVDMVWDDKNTPEKVKKSLKLPVGTTNVDGRLFGRYTFFVGYQVTEAPLNITAEEVVNYNDMETSEGSIEALFDNNLTTFFHSAWSEPVPRQEPFGSYLDFAMPAGQDINAVAMQITARTRNNPVAPKKVSLYYSNVENDDDRAIREEAWTLIRKEVQVKGGKEGSLGDGEVGWIGGVKKDNEWIKADQCFKYLRFCVITNSRNEYLTSTGTTTSKFWNLAELRIYGTKL